MTHDTHTDPAIEEFVPVADLPKGAEPELSTINIRDRDPRYRPIIVVVAGLPRSGKDTFIREIVNFAETATVRLRIHNVSSITTIKDFVNRLEDFIPALSSEMFDLAEPTLAYRTVLSDIKATLDQNFNYTYRRAEALCNIYEARDVLIYQVRETINLKALQYLTNADFLSVHMVREDRPDTPLAPSDKDGLNQYGGFKFDYVVPSRLDDMPLHAGLIYNRMVRITEGTATASNIRRRGRPAKS